MGFEEGALTGSSVVLYGVCNDLLDPGNLVALLRESPFHIDSLLQLSEVSKHNGDNSLAGEFIGKGWDRTG